MDGGRVEERDDSKVVVRERGAAGIATFGLCGAIDGDTIADVVPNNSGEAICEGADVRADSDMDDINLN